MKRVLGNFKARRSTSAAVLAVSAGSFESARIRRMGQVVLPVCVLFLVCATLNTASAGAATRRSKKSVDPVVAIITTAARRHKINSIMKRKWLRDWAVSERAQRTLEVHKPSRATQIAGARTIVTNLTRRHQLFVDRLPMVMAGVHATTEVMLHRAYPAREARIKLDGDAATYGFYPGWGVQVQPLFTFSEGNQLVSLNDAAGVTAIADRMLELDISRLHYRAWEYVFPWQGAKLPWVSAMSEATAMQFYARAWQLTNKANYLTTAKAVLPGFMLSAKKGGLMTYEGSGRWYLLYPFNPSQRILNGHLQSLIGLYDYSIISGDTVATTLVQDGINAVVPLLDRFDTGAWSRYQYGQEADLNYHDLMTTQLNKLSNRTLVQVFRDYGSKFANYRVMPPVVSVSSETSGAVYPVTDGYRDSVSTSWFVDKRSTVLISVVDDQGIALRTYRGDYARGMHPFSWDGRTDGHKIAPAGIYHLSIRATDIARNRSTATSPTSLVVREDITAPQVTHVRVASAGATHTNVAVNVLETESGWVMIRIVRGSVVVGKGKVGRRGGTVKVPLSLTKLRHAKIFVTDTSGNRTIFVL